MAPASKPVTCRGCSSASIAAIRVARAPWAGPGWACPSSSTWWKPWAELCRSRVPRARAPGSASQFPPRANGGGPDRPGRKPYEQSMKSCSHTSSNQAPPAGRWSLQQIAGQLSQSRALALGQIHVGVDALALHTIDEIAEAIGMRVQIGMIDLEDVAGEHHLGALARAGDDGLHLVRGQILRL